MHIKVDQRRVFSLNKKTLGNGPIMYWMSRDQRVHDNWSLLYAQQLAEENQRPLVVVFCVSPNFLEATIRQYGFMLKGVQEVEKELAKFNIPLCVLSGEPPDEIIYFAKKVGAGAVVTDFDPLRIKKQWREKVANRAECVVYEIDAHNIVPCRIASVKQEYAAYTIRPKIHNFLPEFFTSFPSLKKQEKNTFFAKATDWKKIYESLQIDRTVLEVDRCVPGEKAALGVLHSFVHERLSAYDSDRNDPTKDAQSHLSPYLHFGQISAQRVALEVKKSNAPERVKEVFLEELIVRRELADNFCWYNEAYDSVDGFPAWALHTLHEHMSDPREYIYERQDFELARTHDLLWNAAQMQMVKTGKMHGYMRMYWAKKILEWSKNPAEAMRVALYLNDKYELDGRDPNGYAGIAWSIGGVHDRAWFKRNIFGMIRYMAKSGCDRKFDTKKYITTFLGV